MDNQDESDVEIPLLVGESDTSTAATANEEEVIARTLHSAHQNIISNVNFGLLYPHLNQNGILPVDSVPDFMRPMPPDNTANQVNNLIMWLHRCSLEQFNHFIVLLRATSGEGGQAHEELAQVLEENLRRFIADRERSGRKSILLERGHSSGSLDFEDSNTMFAGFPIGRKLCDGCSRKCRDWKCKFWCIPHCVCWAFTLSIGIFLYLFFTHFPNLPVTTITPTHIIGSNILPLDFSNSPNVWWASSLQVNATACNGTLYALKEMNCSILMDTKKEKSLERWAGLPARYFLEGSNFIVDYTFTERPHDFVVLRSYAAHQDYMALCNSLNDTSNYYGDCLNDKTIPTLCAGNTTVSSLLRESSWCFEKKLNVTFYVNESDFYYLLLQFNYGHPYITGVNFVYNSSVLIDWNDKVEYNFTSDASGPQSQALLSLTSQFSFAVPPHQCVVLQSSCPDDSTVMELKYLFVRRQDILVFPSVFLLLCLLLAVMIVICHVCSVWRQNHCTKMSSNRGDT